jgi:hypothetical protein
MWPVGPNASELLHLLTAGFGPTAAQALRPVSARCGRPGAFIDTEVGRDGPVGLLRVRGDGRWLAVASPLARHFVQPYVGASRAIARGSESAAAGVRDCARDRRCRRGGRCMPLPLPWDVARFVRGAIFADKRGGFSDV